MKMILKFSPFAPSRTLIFNPRFQPRRVIHIHGLSNSQFRVVAMAGAGSVQKSEEEWRAILSPEQFRILRQKGTENPGTGEYNKFFGVGTYLCAGCGTPLYRSATKFNSPCGWPSFYEGLPGAINRNVSFSSIIYATSLSLFYFLNIFRSLYHSSFSFCSFDNSNALTSLLEMSVLSTSFLLLELLKLQSEKQEFRNFSYFPLHCLISLFINDFIIGL
uniref:Methionine-R-sulfoxide reductase B2, mitochondrial isoform X1 n=2 Tax=Nicotiana TaxID=4085 RepID=A0A1S3YRZ8_TOBAC|nr:PREDICTED: methionine-R-sulfoxide reductase B2, mitochondrial-like isoform X1 [Nicotiana sylvestris]XP_016454827.1 PREDICTED: methionine-R-sulfoxide reductase B2, mitochondrial-like isoform X1 [Nicotiana tabacum]